MKIITNCLLALITSPIAIIAAVSSVVNFLVICVIFSILFLTKWLLRKPINSEEVYYVFVVLPIIPIIAYLEYVWNIYIYHDL